MMGRGGPGGRMTRAGRGGLLRCGRGRRRDEEEEEEEDRTGGTQEFSPSPTFHSGLQRIVSDTRVNACTCTHRGTHATTRAHTATSVRERAHVHTRTYVPPCIHGPTLVRAARVARTHTRSRGIEKHTRALRAYTTPLVSSWTTQSAHVRAQGPAHPYTRGRTSRICVRLHMRAHIHVDAHACTHR